MTQLDNNFIETEPSVFELVEDDKTTTIIGTAHVSKNSAELVERIIRERKPKVVGIELCKPRFDTITNPESWSNTDIYQVIKSGKVYVLISQIILSSFQKKIADKFGVRPGEEIRRAIEVCNELDIEISLIDREVKTTLKRAWASAGFFSILKLTASLFMSMFSKEEVTEEQIESLKQHDDLTVVINEFGEALPSVKKSLIDERDLYLTGKIKEIESDNIVAVVGAGHVPGMTKNYNQEIDIEDLDIIPKSNVSMKFVKYGIPSIIIAFFVWGFFNLETEKTKDLFLAWFMANGFLSALFTTAALAHPLTILAVFFAAPFTSLNPTIAAGWVAGLVEATFKKPKVKDLQTIADDIGTIKGIYKNKVSRILLVVVLANLGSSIGTFYGFAWMSKIAMQG